MKSIVLALAVIGSVASAQAERPYKLIITWYQSSLTVIDYPSRARCEQARLAVEAQAARLEQQSQAAMPPGSVRIGISANGAFCIPG